MLSHKIGIDDIDCQIMDLIQREPNLTHSEIASHVNRSQPTIGMRIRKLEKLGVLKYQAGVNLRVADLCFARVEVKTKNPSGIFEMVRECPFLLNAFRLSGDTNVSILVVGATYRNLDKVVNIHFRNNPEVHNVHIDIISDVADDIVLPMDLNLEIDGFSLKDHDCGNHSN